MTDDLLSRLEAALAAELRQAAIPCSIEAAVMRHFDRAGARRRAVALTVLSGALAASILAGAVVVEQRHRAPLVVQSTPAAKPAPSQVDVPKPSFERAASKPVIRQHAKRSENTAPPNNSADDVMQFVSIPYSLPLDAQDRATVIRLSLPVPALAAAGLPVIAPEPDAMAQADVLVGEDGQPRAIRLLSISTSENK